MFDRILLRITKIFLAFILLVVLLVIIIPNVMMPIFARPLLRADYPQKNAGAVLVLGGDPTVRVGPAAEAVKAGFAPALYMVDCQSNHLEDAGMIPRESDITIKIARDHGLPRDQIEVILSNGRATSTVDEAKAYHDFFALHPVTPKRVVVVTSWPHSSRAGWILEKGLSPLGITVEMMPVEKVPFVFENWWLSEDGMLFVFEEYVKWGRYLVKFAGRSIVE